MPCLCPLEKACLQGCQKLQDFWSSENMVSAQSRDKLWLLSLCVLSGRVRIAGLFKGTRLLQLLVQLPAQPLYGLLGFSSISKKSPGRLCLALRLIQSCGRQLEDRASVVEQDMLDCCPCSSSPQQACLHTPLLLWQIGTGVVAG